MRAWNEPKTAIDSVCTHINASSAQAVLLRLEGSADVDENDNEYRFHVSKYLRVLVHVRLAFFLLSIQTEARHIDNVRKQRVVDHVRCEGMLKCSNPNHCILLALSWCLGVSSMRYQALEKVRGVRRKISEALRKNERRGSVMIVGKGYQDKPHSP